LVSAGVRVTVHGMPKATIIAAVALCLLCVVSQVNAQSLGVSVNTVFSPQPQIGAFSTATVTISNAGNDTIELLFVGVHFEWENPTVWFIGGHSGQGAILGSGEKISYDIQVAVPANVTTGTYKFFTLVKYRTQTAQGNWTPETDLFWAEPVQVSTAQASSSQTPQGPQETFTPETIALLVVAVAAGLFLERDSVKALFKKPETKPEMQAAIQPEVKPELRPEPIPEPKPESKLEQKPEPRAESKPEARPKRRIRKENRKVEKAGKRGAGIDDSRAASK
jgi:hypothetical protein